MVLINFLFTGKNIKDQEFCSGENMATIALSAATVVFALADTSMRDFAEQ
jgi:hypothetical protein